MNDVDGRSWLLIPHFDQVSVKISVLGSYTLIVAPMGVKKLKIGL